MMTALLLMGEMITLMSIPDICHRQLSNVKIALNSQNCKKKIKIVDIVKSLKKIHSDQNCPKIVKNCGKFQNIV